MPRQSTSHETGKDENERTLSDEVPPCRVERVVRTPASDIRTVCLPGAVLVTVCGAEMRLMVEFRERVDVGPPATVTISSRYGRGTWKTHV